MSLAKAGVVCSLPARTSILAAANPTGGHYNKAKTVSENLKSVSCDVELCCYIIIIVFSTFAFRMNSALLSRFDLVSVCRIQYQSSAHTHTHTHNCSAGIYNILLPSLPLPLSPSSSLTRCSSCWTNLTKRQTLSCQNMSWLSMQGRLAGEKGGIKWAEFKTQIAIYPTAKCV